MAVKPFEPTDPNRPCGLTTPKEYQSKTRRALHDLLECVAIQNSRSLLANRCSNRFAGDQSVGATLVPIPNTIVKPYSADGTPVERPRESRPSPAFLTQSPWQRSPGALHLGDASSY
jgi:hypothetical protein